MLTISLIIFIGFIFIRAIINKSVMDLFTVRPLREFFVKEFKKYFFIKH